MRIAHVTSGVSNRADGVRTTVEQLSAAQVQLGHDVSVSSLATRSQLTTAYKDWAGAELRIVRHAGPMSIGFAPSLPRHLVALNPDIVHAHGLWMYPPYAAAYQHRRVGTPFVLSPHGMLNSFALSLSRWKKRIASVLYQGNVFRAASLIHVTSAKELEEVRDYGLRQPVAVIANGVAGWTDTTPSPKSKTVLTLGRIHPIKGLDRLIAAWARVEAQCPGWKLRIVGPDVAGHAGELLEQARALGISHLTIEAPLYDGEKDAALADASLFILPSLTENFAMTIAESLAAGTPAIVSTGAPWSGIVERACGWWVKPDIEDLAAALRVAMTHPPGVLETMGKRGQAWMREEFAWSSIASKLVGTYDWLLDRSIRPDWVVVD